MPPVRKKCVGGYRVSESVTHIKITIGRMPFPLQLCPFEIFSQEIQKPFGSSS